MIIKLLTTYLTTFGEYLVLVGRMFRWSEYIHMFFKRYAKETCQLGVDSILLVLLISFLIDAVTYIQMKVNVQSPWMPRWTTGYATREIFLLEFTSTFMCLIPAGKVGSNIALELGTMRVTQQINTLDTIGVNPASYSILPEIAGLITIMSFLIIFNSAAGIIGAHGTAYSGVLLLDDLMTGLQYSLNVWFVWMSITKSIVFVFIITSVSSLYGYSVRGGSVEVGEASINAVASGSVLILFADVPLVPLLSRVL